MADEVACHARWRRWALVASLVCAAPALADSAGAKELREGRRHYDLREWTVAIEKFKASYKLAPSREALFNLAQAYRQNGDCKDAVGTYKAYLRNYPDARNRRQVEQFIEDLGDCPAPVVAPTVVPAASAEPDRDREQPDPAPREGGRSGLRMTSYVVGGIGLVGIAAGVKFALDGKAANDDLDAACETSCTPSIVRGIRDRGDTANRNAWIGLGAGAALVGGGILLYVLSRDPVETSGVAIVPTGDGVHATMTVTF